uniref:FERM domain-containing protein 4A n=1 Tax=Lygus hesperus TaxID=30085 RepID=A0A0A9XMU5_LYGHE
MKRQSPHRDAENSAHETLPHPVGAMLKIQHRKQQLEKRLEEKCLELKKLCMKEYELTGVLPMETPLGVDESPPKIRRKVVTMYPYDKELLKQLAQEGHGEENKKRKALSPWNSCDNLPLKSSSPASPKHGTWASPKGHGHSTARSHISKSFKFLKKQLHQ